MRGVREGRSDASKGRGGEGRGVRGDESRGE